MPTAADYVQQFRAANPKYSNYDDAEILQTVAEQAESEGKLAENPVLQEALQQARQSDRGLGGEVLEGLKRGGNDFKAKLYDTAALAGAATGIDGLKDWGREGSEQGETDASLHPASVASYKDIHSVKDFTYYLAGQLGAQTPMIAGTTAAAAAAAALAPEEIVGAGVVSAGGLLARGASALGLTAARTAAGGVAGAALADGATGIGVKQLAGFLAGQAVGFSQMQSYSQLEKQGGDNVVPLAIANGLIAGALQTVIPLRFLNGSGGKELEKHAAEIVLKSPSWIVNPALHAAKEGSIGMLAGIAQEAVGITTEAMSGNGPDLSTDNVAHRLIEGGIGGFLGGGGMGLLRGVMEARAPQQQTEAPSPDVVRPQPEEAPVQQAPLDVPAPQIRPIPREVIEQQQSPEESQFTPGKIATPEVQRAVDVPTDAPIAAVPTIKAAPLLEASDRFFDNDRVIAAQKRAEELRASARSYDRPVQQAPEVAIDSPVTPVSAPSIDQYQKAQARAAQVREGTVKSVVSPQEPVSVKAETPSVLKPDVVPEAKTPIIAKTHFEDGNSVTRFAYPENPMPEMLTQAKKGTPLVAIFRDKSGNEFSAPVVYNHNEVKIVPEGATAGGSDKVTIKEAAKQISEERTAKGEKLTERTVNGILNNNGTVADVTKPSLVARNAEVLKRAWELGWRGNAEDKVVNVAKRAGLDIVGYAETAKAVTEGGLRPLPKDVSEQAGVKTKAVEAPLPKIKDGVPLVTKEMAKQFVAANGYEADSINGLLQNKSADVRKNAIAELSKYILAGKDELARKSFGTKWEADPKAWAAILDSTEKSMRSVAEDLSRKTNTQKIGANVSEAAGLKVENDKRARDTAYVERVQPESESISDGPIRQELDRAKNIARSHGIDISESQASKAIKAGGRYNPSTRSVMLILKNLVEPSRQDLISAWHEIFHDAVREAPPIVQEALNTLVEKRGFADILQGNPEADPRVSGKVSTLHGAELTDERLVERLALMGVDRKAAEGIIPAVWRALKDHFIQAAMYIQENIVGSDFLGTKLAEAYADNMVSKIRAGDKMTLDSFLSNWAKPFTTAQATPALVKDGTFAARRSLNSDGTSTYPRARGLDSDAMEHNIEAGFAELHEKLAATNVVQNSEIEAFLNDAGFTVKREAAEEAKKIMSRQLSIMIPEHRKQIAAANQLSQWHHQLYESHLATLQVYSEGELAALRAQGKPQPAVPDYDTFLTQFGLENADNKSQKAFDKITAQFKEEGVTPEELGVNIDPKIKIDDLKTDGDKQHSLHMASVQLAKDLARIADRTTQASKDFDRLKVKADRRSETVKVLDNRLLDSKESDRIVRQYLGQYLKDVPRQMDRLSNRSEDIGFMQGVLSEIEKKPENISKYTDKLIHSINLEDVPISGVLRSMFQMQKDGEFNLKSDAPSKIQAAMARAAEENPESPIADLVKLHEDPMKSNVLLAGIITFAKQEEGIARLVEHQLFRTKEDIAALNKWRDQIREKNDDKLNKAFEALQLQKESPSDATAYTWHKARQKALSEQIDMYQAERVKNSGESLQVALTQMKAAVDQRLQAGYQVYMLPGANTPNPASPDVKSAEIWSDKHSIKLLGKENGDLDQAQVEGVLANQKRWIDARKDDPSQHDLNYQSMVRLYTRMRDSIYLQKDKYATIGGMLGGRLDSHARVALLTKSRSGELVASKLTRHVEGVDTGKVFALNEGAKVERKAEHFYKAIGLDAVDANDLYLNWAKDAFETRAENIFTHEDSFNYLKSEVARSADPVLAPLKNPKTWALFTDWIKAELSVDSKLSKLNFEVRGNRVADEALKVLNPLTGNMEAAERAPINYGVQTSTRFISDRAMAVVRADNLANTLRAIKTTGLTELEGQYNETWRERMSNALNQITSSDKVWNTLITPLFTDNPNSTLPVPAREDGIKLPVQQAKVKAAFKGKDILAIAGQIYDDMGGSTVETKDAYQLKVAGWMLNMLNRLGNIASPPTEAGNINMDFTGLPRVMMDSRETLDMPTSWLERKSMTRENINGVIRAISANHAFGRDFKEMGALISDMAAEVNARAETWRGMNRTERAALRKSDRAQYEELKASEQKSNEIGPNGKRYFETLDAMFSPAGVGNPDPSIIRDLWGLSVSMMLVGPRSAVRNLISPINRFADTKSIAPEVWYDIGHAYTGLAKQFMASLWNIAGVKTWIPSERMYRLTTEMLGGNPSMTQGIKDILAGHRGPDFANDRSDARGKVAVRKFLTRARAVLLHSRLTFAENPKGPVMQPNFFQWSQVNQNLSDFFTESHRYEVTATKIADFYKENPERIGTRVTGKEIGVSGNYFENKMASWYDSGLDPHRLAEKLLKSDNTETIDSDTLSKLWTHNSSKITGEGSYLNRPAATLTTSFGKFTSTLLGFPMFQTAKIVNMARTAEGRTTLKSVAQALTVMGLGILPASVAFSKLLDEYDEELVGKHPANRPFTDDVGNNLTALAERVVSAGTLGFAGDIIPTVMDVAGSPSGRNMISLDNRIVWVNQALNLAKSIKNVIAMGPENVNYANFFRPLMNTAGMLGPLQNLDVANHLATKLGIDTRALPGVGGLLGAESDIINRQSVYSWLRGAAYASKLEVRGAGQGDYTPNEATPYITDMALAAYSNDREGFQKAYIGAIKAAQNMGIATDAFSYVKRAYASRNPLSSVLKNRPSTGEYAQLLMSMPDDGRLAVQHAVNLFNMYGAGLGITPFNGIDASDPRRTTRINNERIRDSRSWF